MCLLSPGNVFIISQCLCPCHVPPSGTRRVSARWLQGFKCISPGVPLGLMNCEKSTLARLLRAHKQLFDSPGSNNILEKLCQCGRLSAVERKTSYSETSWAMALMGVSLLPSHVSALLKDSCWRKMLYEPWIQARLAVSIVRSIFIQPVWLTSQGTAGDTTTLHGKCFQFMGFHSAEPGRGSKVARLEKGLIIHCFSSGGNNCVAQYVVAKWAEGFTWGPLAVRCM